MIFNIILIKQSKILACVHTVYIIVPLYTSNIHYKFADLTYHRFHVTKCYYKHKPLNIGYLIETEFVCKCELLPTYVYVSYTTGHRMCEKRQLAFGQIESEAQANRGHSPCEI